MPSRCTRANGGVLANALRSSPRIKAMMQRRYGRSCGSVGFGHRFRSRVWKSKKHRGRPIKKEVPRFQAERTFAWFQKKYRRLVVRWERLAACFDAFLAVATIHIWVQKLIVG
jgi:hypothetical protein